MLPGPWSLAHLEPAARQAVGRDRDWNSMACWAFSRVLGLLICKGWCQCQAALDLFMSFPEMSSWCGIPYSTPHSARAPDRPFIPINPVCSAHTFWSSWLLSLSDLLTLWSLNSKTHDHCLMLPSRLTLYLSVYGPVSSVCSHPHSVDFWGFFSILSLIQKSLVIKAPQLQPMKGSECCL